LLGIGACCTPNPVVLDLPNLLPNTLLVVEAVVVCVLPNPPKMFFGGGLAKIEDSVPITGCCAATPLKRVLWAVFEAGAKGDDLGYCGTAIPPKASLLGVVVLSFGVGGGLAIAVKWWVVWKKGVVEEVSCGRREL